MMLITVIVWEYGYLYVISTVNERKNRLGPLVAASVTAQGVATAEVGSRLEALNALGKQGWEMSDYRPEQLEVPQLVLETIPKSRAYTSLGICTQHFMRRRVGEVDRPV